MRHRYLICEEKMGDMALPQQTHWTESEYLAFERESAFKHEFLNGEIVAMAGASRYHNLIVSYTIGALTAKLRGTRCRVYPSDMRVHMPASGDYAYPDMSIVCGEDKFRDDQFDTLTNPIIIIEVLSPNTEPNDRGIKFQKYRQIETLQTYVLIAQDQPRIEWFTRQPSGQWLLTEAVGLEAKVDLAAANCELALAEVYAEVNFEEDSSSTT